MNLDITPTDQVDFDVHDVPGVQPFITLRVRDQTGSVVTLTFHQPDTLDTFSQRATFARRLLLHTLTQPRHEEGDASS